MMSQTRPIVSGGNNGCSPSKIVRSSCARVLICSVLALGFFTRASSSDAASRASRPKLRNGRGIRDAVEFMLASFLQNMAYQLPVRMCLFLMMTDLQEIRSVGHRRYAGAVRPVSEAV